MTILANNFANFWTFYTLTEQEETAETEKSLGDSTLNENVKLLSLQIADWRKVVSLLSCWK